MSSGTSAEKSGADQSRRFGFKETREQYEQRKKQEKHAKWEERIAKEDLTKLRVELTSLEKASFLAPQQNERKRLVQRMIKGLEAKSAPKAEAEPEGAVASNPPARPASESDSDDDFLFSKNTATHDEDKRLFVPRALRRKEEEKPAEQEKTPLELAEEAEKELIAAEESGEDLDAFLDALT